MPDNDSKAKDSLLAVVGCLTQLLYPVAAAVLLITFLKGAVWASETLLPLSTLLSFIALGASLFIFGPMAIFRPLRQVSGVGLVASSFVVGITLWLLCLLYVYAEWGLGWLIGGLIFAGVGV